MVFNKLAANNSRNRRTPRSRFAESEEEIDDDDDLRVLRSRPDSAVSGGRSWEHLLTWWPDYDSFAGVFKDISELPHTTMASEMEQCRPSPLGDRQAEEEYIWKRAGLRLQKPHCVFESDRKRQHNSKWYSNRTRQKIECVQLPIVPFTRGIWRRSLWPKTSSTKNQETLVILKQNLQ